MEVATVISKEGRKRYMLLDEAGDPVRPVLKFLRFKDNSGSARNSLRAYCQHLKLFFEFLSQQDMEYRDVGIDDMAGFLRWLQSPYRSLNVLPVSPVTSPRKPQTINVILSTVLSFYDYLMRHEDYSNQLSEKLKRSVPGSRRGFKGFLHHINKNKNYFSKILKVKAQKSRPKTIEKKHVQTLIEACSNLRDRFLIRLLWESSMRIGEALALWLEDFEIDECKIRIRDRGSLVNGAEIKTVCSPRTVDVSQDLIDLFLEYVTEYFTDDVDTNHVLIKHTRDNKYQPLEYQDVYSLFCRLKAKTGIAVTPHALRHTSLTELHKAGWSPVHLQKRAGHANVQTTMQIYIHPSEEDMRKDWESIQDRMCSLNEKPKKEG